MKIILLIILSALAAAAQSVNNTNTLEAFIRSQLTHSFFSMDPKCGTRYGMMIHTHPEQITPALRDAYIQAVSKEPVRQQSALTSSGNFMLHWDESGMNAVPTIDQSGNGIPDYIDSAAVVFDYVRHVEIEEMGYQAPPDQNGEPAVPYHIYFSSLGFYGVTTPSYVDIEALPGVNYTSYIEVENDYLGFPTPGLEGLKVTAAHEFHHAVQLGYNVNWDDTYFLEMTSTWMEEMLYPEIDDYLNYLADLFNSVSNTRFTSANGFYPYANSLYLQMLSTRYGKEIVRVIWENIKTKSSLPAIKSALDEENDSWPASLNAYGLWLYYTGERTQPGMFFGDAEYFPQVRIKPVDVIRFENNFSGDITLEDNANRYLEFNHIAGNILNIDAVATSNKAGFRGMTRFSYSPYYPVNNPLLNQIADADTIVVMLTNAGDLSQGYTLSLSVGATISLSEIYAFPNPANINEVPVVRFQNIPSSALLSIYNVVGNRIAVVEANGASTVRSWNLTNARGEIIQAGVYMYLVQNEGTTQTGKFAVLR